MDLALYAPEKIISPPNILVVGEDHGFEKNNELLSMLEVEVGKEFHRSYTRAAHLLVEGVAQEPGLLISSRRRLITNVPRSVASTEFLIIDERCEEVGADIAALLVQSRGDDFMVAAMYTIANKTQLFWFSSRIVRRMK